MASPGMRSALENLLAPRGRGLTPEQAQRFATQPDNTYNPETGYIEGGIRAALRGLAQIPREVGDALEYNREVQETGDKSRRNFVNVAGSALSDAAEAGQNMIEAPVAGGNYTKQSLFGGVESLPVSIAYGIPSLVGAIVGGAAGAPSGPGALASGAAGAALGQAASSVPMYRASAQRTYEEMRKANPGIDPAVAAEATRKTARAEVIGEGISTLPEALLFSRIPGGKAVATTARELLRPGFRATAKQFAKNVAMSMPGEQVGEGYTSFQQQKAWNEVMPENQRQDPWQAVKESAGSTAVMTLLMAGMGSGVQAYRARGAVKALEDPSTPLASRHMAVLEVASKLKEIDPQKSDNWLRNATVSMLRGEVIPTDDTFLRSPQELAKETEEAGREATGITPTVPFGAPQAAVSPFDVSQADPNAGAYVPRTSALTGLPLADQRAFTAPQTRSPITGLVTEDQVDLGADQRALAARDAASSRVANMLRPEQTATQEETTPPLDLIGVRDSLNSKTGVLAAWSNKKGGFGSAGEFAAEIRNYYPTLADAWEQWGKPGRSELVAAINAELKGKESKNLKPETREMRQALLTALKEDLTVQQAAFMEGLRAEAQQQQSNEQALAVEQQMIQAEAQGVPGGDTSFDINSIEAGTQPLMNEQFSVGGRALSSPFTQTPNEARAQYEARGEAVPYHLLDAQEQAVADQADYEAEAQGEPQETAYSFGKMKPADLEEMKLLRPAASVNGTMYTGNVGDMHHQVMAKSGVTAWDTTRDNVRLGFVTPDGTFLRRDEAAAWLEQNDKETYRNIKSPYLLESVDYGLAKELYADESEAVGKFANMYDTKAAPEATPLTKTLIQGAFPGQKVTETATGFLVGLDNGAAIRIEKTGDISFNLAAAEAGLGRKLQQGEKPVAAWKPLDPLGMVIQLTDKGMGSLDHETFHAAVTLALTKGERTALYNKYGKKEGLSWKEAEERMAEAYQAWRDAAKPKPDTFFQKLQDFFLRIKDLFINSPEAVFRAVENGEVWGRSQATTKQAEIVEAYSFGAALNVVGKSIQGAKLGKSGGKVSKLIQAFTPMDRMIDLTKDRKPLGYVRENIVKVGGLLQKQRALQDKLLSDAKLLLDNEVLAHVKRDKGMGIDPAKLNAVHEMMARMTRWGFDPSGTVGDRFTDENLWKTVGMAEQTGLSLAAAKAKVSSEWRRLSPEVQKGIVDMMLLNKKALELQREVNLGNIRQLLGDSPEAQAQVAKIEKRFRGLSGPYFTLDHPGQHVVRVFDGRTTLFAQSFDDVRDADALKKQIEKDPVGFLKGEGRMDADKFDAIEVMYDRKAPFTRLTVHVPESFMNRLKGLTDKAGAVDLRKELRAIYRDAQRDVDSGRYQFPDALMDKLKEASKAGSVKQADDLLNELATMVGAAKEEQALFDEVTASIDGARIGADLAESLKQDFEQLWIATLPESSILKNMSRRTIGGVAGYDKNMTRSFLAYHQKHARAMAFMKYGTQAQRELREIDKKANGETDTRAKMEAKEFTQTIRDHQERVLTEKVSPLVKTMTKIPFLWYLSSPSALIVQSSQPYTITLPFLAARFSYSKAMGAINAAYGRQMRMDFTNKKLLEFNDKHRELIDKLSHAEDKDDTAEMNRLTKGLSMQDLEKAAIAISPTLPISLSHEAFDMISSGNPGGEGITKKLGWFMAVSETGSRKAGFVAAFNLKYEQTGDFAQATKFATDAVNDTLYDYSAGNRPKILTGNIGRLVGQFRTYQVQTLFKVGKLFMDSVGAFPLSKEEKAVARKELMFLLANNFALAGVAGLPMAGSVIMLLNVFNALFGDDDEPWDAELELGNFLRGSLGDDVGSAVQKGPLSALLGMDISKRIGMGGLSSVFQSDPPTGKHGADLAGWYAANAMGPWFTSMVTAPLRGWDAYRKGDWVDAFRMGMPKPVADLARAYTTATEGQIAGGKVLKQPDEFNPYQILLAALGVNPLEMSLASEEYRQESSYSTLITERRGLLVRKFAQAAVEGDYDEAEAAKDEVRAFNERMPKFALKASDLARGVKNLKDKRRGKKNKKEKTMEEWLGTTE